MNTPNIGLEMIVLDDTLNKSMINKINNNMKKLDNKYGELKESLLAQTRKETLEEAIAYIQTLADRIAELEATGTASASSILAGKTAVIKGQVITGNIPSVGAQNFTPRNNKSNNKCWTLFKWHSNYTRRC